MTPAQILAAIAFAKTLAELIQQGFEQARAKGELTPELDAAYQEHQRWVYAQPYAQPAPDATKPDV
jgi:hypothetical protein